MNIEARKKEFIEEFLKIQSEEVILRLEKLLKKEKTSSLQEMIKPMSVAELNLRIDQSTQDSINGRLLHSDELKTIIEKWN
jgi:hypothetical protein